MRVTEAGNGLDVYEWRSFIVARFCRGSVLVDRRSSSIFELRHPAALALDILADHGGRMAEPWSTELCARVRASMPTVRDQLLGERELAPGEGVTVEGLDGQPLLRRIAEPSQWRTPANVSRSASDGVAIAGAILRVKEGALVVLTGQRRDARELAGGFEELGSDAIARDVLELNVVNRAAPELQSRAWGEASVVREVWTLALRPTDNVVLSRLTDGAALVALLEAALERPSLEDVRSLALTCMALPLFRANVPRGGHMLAETLRRHGAR